MADRTTAIAIFDDRTEAQRAIEQLKRAGFTEREIGVTARDVDETDSAGVVEDGGKKTHAKEGAIAGVAAGAGVGALWGLGILAGVVPGIGTAIAGGTLAAILSSAAAGAATAGIAGTLIGLGIPEEEANYYDREFQAGRVLVTVDAGRRVQEAQAILMENRGYEMGSAPTRAGGGAGIAGMRSEANLRSQRGEAVRTLEVREEELGDVTVGERMTEDEAHVEATLAKENVKVDKKRGRGARTTPPR